MGRFLRNIALFSLAVLLLAFGGDRIVSKGLSKTERGHFYTINALMNNTLDADVVILGNSRASGSYHPCVMDTILHVDTRNLGVSGQPFGVSYLRWQLYRRRNHPPKLLIVNIDYSELNMVTNGYEKEQYYPYMSDSLVKPYLGLYGFSWGERHIPMYRYRGDYKLMGIGLMEFLGIRHDTKGDYCKGFSNPFSNWNGTNLKAELKKGKVKGVSMSEAVDCLQSLLDQAESERFPVVFVYAPVYKELKDNLDEQESMAVYRQMADRYGIPILDFSQREYCADTCFFKDANHVNAAGADLFSQELAHAIDSLGVLR